jgi:hypothetical protein
MDLEIAAARLALAKLSSEQAIAAASAALDRGVYSDSLGLLMDQEPIWSEVGPLFKQALSELSIPIPSRESASRILARESARRIVDGEVTPYEGAREIWWEVANEDGADESLRIYVGLASEWEDAPAHRLQYEAMIMEEARRLAVSGKGQSV